MMELGIFLIVLIFCPGIILGAMAGAVLGSVLNETREIFRGTPFLFGLVTWIAGAAIRAVVPSPDPSAQFVSLVEDIGPYVANGLLGLGLLLFVISFGILVARLFRRHAA